MQRKPKSGFNEAELETAFCRTVRSFWSNAAQMVAFGSETDPAATRSIDRGKSARKITGG